ncbi:PFL_4669 family integrating conjugative element protein [Alicycliphilus denitrificans]|uniref:PFL_4669 family integrating conjugative element protein n=1 Tax=Alicycliphilus denitrificans TaxID=179636 RepID=UPI003850A6EE
MATIAGTKQADQRRNLDSIDLQGILPSPQLQFLKEENSPFSDGYSISKEENFLADFIKIGAPESDLRFDRYAELLDRRERLAIMESERAGRRGADVLISSQDAQAADDLGVLVDEGVDQMTIHTIEALRMFQGRSRDPSVGTNAIIGGKRVASSLRNLWLLTSNNNPYADWALVRHEQGVSRIQRHLEAEVAKCEDVLEQQRRRGLTFSVAASSKPAMLNLGFRSPYGYDIAKLISSYDFFVRLQKTLQRKSLQTDEEARHTLQIVSRSILSVFYGTARFDRWLMRKEIQSLNRGDWVSADPEAAKRLEFAVSVFGPVPSAIYKTEMSPAHSRRRYSITDAERHVLRQVGAQLEVAEMAEVSQRLQPESDASAAAASEAAAGTT